MTYFIHWSNANSVDRDSGAGTNLKVGGAPVQSDSERAAVSISCV